MLLTTTPTVETTLDVIDNIAQFVRRNVLVSANLRATHATQALLDIVHYKTFASGERR